MTTTVSVTTQHGSCSWLPCLGNSGKLTWFSVPCSSYRKVEIFIKSEDSRHVLHWLMLYITTLVLPWVRKHQLSQIQDEIQYLCFSEIENHATPQEGLFLEMRYNAYLNGKMEKLNIPVCLFFLAPRI